MVRFEDKLKALLKERGLTLRQMEWDTGICRLSFAPSRAVVAHRPSTLMAMAYYLQLTVEDLVEDTDLEDHWHDRSGDRTKI